MLKHSDSDLITQLKQTPEFMVPYLDMCYAIGEHPTARNYFARAQHLANFEVYQAAIADCDKALERIPSFAEAWHLRGMINHRCEQIEQAIADYEWALHYNPRLQTARWELARILVQIRKMPVAKSHLEVLITLDPQHKSALKLLGKVICVCIFHHGIPRIPLAELWAPNLSLALPKLDRTIAEIKDPFQQLWVGIYRHCIMPVPEVPIQTTQPAAHVAASATAPLSLPAIGKDVKTVAVGLVDTKYSVRRIEVIPKPMQIQSRVAQPIPLKNLFVRCQQTKAQSLRDYVIMALAEYSLTHTAQPQNDAKALGSAKHLEPLLMGFSQFYPENLPLVLTIDLLNILMRPNSWSFSPRLVEADAITKNNQKFKMQLAQMINQLQANDSYDWVNAVVQAALPSTALGKIFATGCVAASPIHVDVGLMQCLSVLSNFILQIMQNEETSNYQLNLSEFTIQALRDPGNKQAIINLERYFSCVKLAVEPFLRPPQPEVRLPVIAVAAPQLRG